MDTRSKAKTVRLNPAKAPRRRLPIDDGGTQQLAGFETPRTSQPPAQSSEYHDDEVQMNLSAEDRAALDQMDVSARDPESLHLAIGHHLRDQMQTFTQLDRNAPPIDSRPVLTLGQYQQWLIDQGFMPNQFIAGRQTDNDNGTHVVASNDQPPMGNQNANRTGDTNNVVSASATHHANNVNNGAATSNAHRMDEVNYGASTSTAHRSTEINNGATASSDHRPDESNNIASTATNARVDNRRTGFSANPDLHFAPIAHRLPPLPYRVTAPENGNRRREADMRFDYLRRITEYKSRLLTEPMDEETLRMILDNTISYVDRIVKYVEHRENTAVLEQDELVANETLWEQAIDVGSFIKTNINTKLRYLEAGHRPAAAPTSKAQARLNAKIVSFSGEWEDWPNFKALWTEYYHNCDDLTKLDLMIKLDEFIVPRSEPFSLIASYDRSLPEAYDVAWNRLCATYDNRRRQVDDVIEKFILMPKVEDNRAGYLIVQSHITSLLEALPRFGVNVTTWDPILMHIIEKKLTSPVKSKWHTKRAPREVARLQPFMEFLTREIDGADDSDAPAPVPHEQRYDTNNHQRTSERRTQQNHQRSNDQPAAQASRSNGNGHQNGNGSRTGSSSAPNGNQRQQQNGGASNGTARGNGKAAKPKKCPICMSSEHAIYSCAVFNRSNMDDRKTKAKKAGLCLNCLRPKCSVDRCTLGTCPNGCNEKHNRLICPKSFAPTVNVVQQAEPNQQ